MQRAPSNPESTYRQIEDLLRRRQPRAAVALAQRLVEDRPDHPVGWILLTRARQQDGDFAAALASARRAVEIDGRQPGANLLLAECLLQTGAAERGLAALEELERGAQDDPRLLQHLAQLYTHANRHVEAERCYAQAAALMPGDPQYLYNLATGRIALGRLTEAEGLLNQVIAIAPADYDAYYNRSTLRTQTPQDNHLAELERVLAAPLRNPMGAVQLNHALAKELEDLGDHARSFAHLKTGADARRAMLSYRVEDDIDAMAQIARVFTSDVFANAAGGHRDRRPIFVLGLPRSGTTLVDRILSSHSAVASIGETSDFAQALMRSAGHGDKTTLIRRSASLDFARLGKDYGDSVDALDGTRPHLIDKTPVNFLYLGLIALALPDARIVHVRRGPMDVCYAMYKTLFRMAYPFSYDLGDLGRYFLAYARLMAHWRAVLPGRFLDLDYEDLIANQEAASRRLVAHCGLDWESACLAFERNASPSLTASAAQVRQPIHNRSVGLWRRYARELAPLADILRAAGVDIDAP
ncbi:MAG TPA: sulfotransferase [Rhizomicrobium sp.]